MFEALFGPEMPLAARFFLAFLVVLGLIGGAAYLVRRFGADRLGTTAARGRQPRLAVIDATPVDSRRRLVLIRRDNVEHLLLIGGPSDVVVEPNIVRAAAARDTQPARAATPAEPGRAAALAESNLWPLQPEPARAAARTSSPLEDAASWPLQPQSEQAPPRIATTDPLAGLGLDSPRSITGREPPIPAPERAERTVPERAERIVPERAERTVPERVAAPTPPAVVAQPGPAPDLVAADQNLAEMAQRLEAALRRPMAGGESRSTAKPAAKAVGEPKGRQPVFSSEFAPPAVRSAAAAAAAASAEPARITPIEPKPVAPAEAKPPHAQAVFESLEQEMASLLGRPNEKT
jgi:flagellar protein FliO/FliZ